jgi:hypothetical protein
MVSKGIWVKDITGVERRVGGLEMEIQQFAGRDVQVRHTLNIDAEKIPPMLKGLIQVHGKALLGAEIDLQDFEGQLVVYINRRAGLRSVKGVGKYADQKFEFWGKPVHGRYLRITSRWGGRTNTNLMAYDPRLPFGTGGSPFLGMKNLREGSQWQVSFFDPFTRQSLKRLIKVVGRETIKHRGKPVECFVLTAHQVTGQGEGGRAATYSAPSSKAWVSVEDGQLLREEAKWWLFSLALVLEDSVTERDYRKRLKSPLPDAGRAVRGKPGAPEKSKQPKKSGESK